MFQSLFKREILLIAVLMSTALKLLNANLMLSAGMPRHAEGHSVIILKPIDISMMISRQLKLSRLLGSAVGSTVIPMIFAFTDVPMQPLASIISNFAITLTWY